MSRKSQAARAERAKQPRMASAEPAAPDGGRIAFPKPPRLAARARFYSRVGRAAALSFSLVGATLCAGTLGYPWRRFVLFDAAAALGWALYASLLGYFGGHAFEAAPWKGLLLALGIAFSVAGAIEVVRWYLRRAAKPS